MKQLTITYRILTTLLEKHTPLKSWISKRESFNKKLGLQKYFKSQLRKRSQYLENI